MHGASVERCGLFAIYRVIEVDLFRITIFADKNRKRSVQRGDDQQQSSKKEKILFHRINLNDKVETFCLDFKEATGTA